MLAASEDNSSFQCSTSEGRLIIEKIIVENFKSYAGKQEIGPFHKSFSSVVGPNGSGKSNVIDAIMFVLGYRAKKMRQTKLADLIHLSEGLNNLDSCSVVIHFKRIRESDEQRAGSDEFEEVPGSSFYISRTAYRNNRSVYYINQQTSSYQEITQLLKDNGVDLDHKRFLILQGEIEAIALMKPKSTTENDEGLLEYLEDIIGTNKYIEMIEESGRALDVACEKHSERLIRVRAAEKECQALAAEKAEAENYLRQENTRTERKNELLQGKIWKMSKENSTLELSLMNKKNCLEEERRKNQDNVKLVEQMEDTLKEAVRDSSEMEKQTRLLQDQLSNLEQNDIKMQETRRILKNKLKNLTKSSSDQNKQMLELKRNLENIEMNIKDVSSDLLLKRTELETAKVELGKITSSLQGTNSHLQRELEEKQQQLSPFQSQLRSLNQEVDLIDTQQNLLTQKLNSGQDEVSKTLANKQKVTETLGLDQERRGLLMGKKTELESQIKESVGKLRDLENDRAETAKSLQLLQTTIAEATSALQDDGSSQGNAVHRAIMKESKSGRINGIHGRLGDLGAIDQKYDVAVATACGYLDHLVVDNTASGQQCIEYLRKSNGGRANFIILDKMRPAPPPPSNLPKNANRLFDLIKIKDERYREAMYFAVSETLVASSIEEAREWAYGSQRWRVVTVDGKLFETSGTISGGGQPRRGGMGRNIKSAVDSASKITEEQVEMLQVQCRETHDSLRAIMISIAKEERIKSEFEEQLIRCTAELTLRNESVRNLTKEKELIEASLSRLSKQSTSSISAEDEKELKRLQTFRSKIEKDINEVKNLMSPIEQSIASIQQAILDAGGLKLKVQLSKVEGLEEIVENSTRRISELEKEKITVSKRHEILKSGQRDEDSINKTEAELADLDSKINETTTRAIDLQTKFKQLEKRLDERNDQVIRLKEQLDEVGKSVAKFRLAEYELRCQIENEEEKFNSNKVQMEKCREELSSLVLHRIDDESGNSSIPVLATFEQDEAELEEICKNAIRLQQTIDSITARLEDMRPNLKVLDEYREKKKALVEQQTELSSIEEQRNEIRSKHEGLRRLRLDEFMAGFRQISARLKELYQLLTMGGNAELELVDSLDPFSEGVLFSVMPPRKSWKNICNLSGGEKTLSSLALVFSLHTYRPTPIYIMDEIDAALDFRNVSIVAKYIKERTRDAQFIVISLRNDMFEMADRLVGIYKTHQRTKSITINPRNFSLPSITASPSVSQ